MARETKVGLLVGMGVILLIGIIISDHLSVVQKQDAADLTNVAREAQETLGTYGGDGQVAQVIINQDGVPTPLSQQRATPIPMPNEQVNTHLAGAGVPVTGGVEPPQFSPAPVEPEAPRPLAIHTVKQGDSLYRISALHYGDASNYTLIQAANPTVVGPQGQLQVNSKLIIPQLPQPAETAAVPQEFQDPAMFDVVQDTHSPAPAPAAQRERVAVVRAGQTLMDISREHLGTGHRWKEILALNSDKIRRPQDLKIGMQLKLPAAPAATPAPAAAPVTASVPTGRPGSFVAPSSPVPAPVSARPAPATTVRPVPVTGPTPAIAPGTVRPAPSPSPSITAPNVPWPDATSGSAPAVRPVSLAAAPAPVVETRAAAPVVRSYTVQPGDTLSLIAAKTLGDKNKWQLIYQANRGKLPNQRDLKVGQVLTIPAR